MALYMNLYNVLNFLLTIYKQKITFPPRSLPGLDVPDTRHYHFRARTLDNERNHSMKQRNFFVTSALALLVIGIAAFGTIQTSTASSAKDIVDTAISAGSFNTLVTAVKAADLVSTLKGEGPFTVFAPTDAAFAKLPKGTLEALLNDKEKLKAVLTYHVVPGKVMAADVAKMKTAKTANGKSLTISTADGSVMVNSAKVIQTDVAASNGVIHAIDTVVLPN